MNFFLNKRPLKRSGGVALLILRQILYRIIFSWNVTQIFARGRTLRFYVPTICNLVFAHDFFTRGTFSRKRGRFHPSTQTHFLTSVYSHSITGRIS